MRVIRCICGAVYNAEEHNSSRHREGEINCEYCGLQLIKWSGDVYYECSLKKAPNLMRGARVRI